MKPNQQSYNKHTKQPNHKLENKYTQKTPLQNKQFKPVIKQIPTHRNPKSKKAQNSQIQPSNNQSNNHQIIIK